MTSPARHLRAVFQVDQRARGQRVDRRNLGVRERDFLALGVDQADGRTQLLAAALLGVEHHGAGQAGHFVQLRGDGEAVHEVVELDHTGHFGDDRMGVRIPGRADLAARHHVAFLDGDHRAVGNLVALALATELVHHADLARARDGNQVPLLVLHGLDVMEADRALVAHFDARGRRCSRGRATDVERAHRELRARLADRLRGDDTHRLADADDRRPRPRSRP